MVPKCTSSGPSAILIVLAAAQSYARTVSDDNPAVPCTCIAMSSTFRAMFGAATCKTENIVLSIVGIMSKFEEQDFDCG
ncbi:hypothetical protein SLE2022_165530 [Rubroshorea leprosula]